MMYELRDAEATLSAFGTIVDQETGEIIRYDPDKIAPSLQRGILNHVSDTPRDSNGFKKWLAVLASRQVGKSVCSSLAGYIHTAYHPGSYAAIIADTKDRADDLFRAILNCHDYMPDEVKMPTIPNRESRQLTFSHNAKIRTLSAEQNMVGIGRAVDFLQWSECPFASDAPGLWNGIYPAIINRKEAGVLLESTPAPMSQPGAEWYRDMCAEARKGLGRFDFLFAPFFSSLLNERRWKPEWTITTSEQRMLDKHGPKGNQPLSAPGDWRYLTLENLAFRREVLQGDPEIRRNPDLFNVFFPSDPITCWVQPGSAAIPMHALERHLKSVVIPWKKGEIYQEYADPSPGALYVIGVDPAKGTGGDQASFQVLEVWGDEWSQVATFSSNTTDSSTLARIIIEKAERWNDAHVIVENNGVGVGTLAFLELATAVSGTVMKDEHGVEKRYHLKNLYYHKYASKAGQTSGVPAGARTNAEALSGLIDALIDVLVIRDAETLDQLQTYRRDKEVEESDKWAIMNPGKVAKGRRRKHHWDRVSALAWAVYLARTLPTRYRPKTQEQLDKEKEAYEVEMQSGLTYNQMRAMERKQKEKDRRQQKGKRRGRYGGKRTRIKRRTR